MSGFYCLLLKGAVLCSGGQLSHLLFYLILLRIVYSFDRANLEYLFSGAGLVLQLRHGSSGL